MAMIKILFIKYETNLLFQHVFLFQDLVHLSRGRRTLKLLTVQQLVL